MKHKTLLVGLILLTLLFPNFALSENDLEEEAIERSARELYGRIMCPLCAGQTIAQSSNETSKQMRDLVLKKLRQGETKEEVLEYFVSRYGERIMAMPNKRGLNLMLWFLPFVLVAIAAILIFSMIRRWYSKGRVEEDPHFEEARLSEYKERLEKELKEFGEDF